ncbi:MAG TPA: DUF6443 domain-containing protein, partial [Puia sp.]|nr:DUF6443 domain-containing protein [Puia sp.]
MQKLIFLVICLAGFVGVAMGQASVSGPGCVVGGNTYSYTLFSASSNFSYTITNGALTTGGNSGSHSGSTNTTVSIIWNSSFTSGSISLSSSSGNASETVTITTALVGGTITGGTQNINYNTIPASLTCTAASGEACPANYVYQWMQSTDDVNFSNISGATGVNLSFTTALTATHYYKRMVTEINSGSTAYSNVETVNVYPQLVTGTVSPSSQSINYNTVPSTMTVAGTTGGAGGYTYQWQWCATSNGTYTTISGATSSSYTPAALTATTYYEVVQSNNGISVTSAPAVVNVYPPLNAGSISPASETINYNTNGWVMTLSGVSGGTGTYAYQWQSSPNNSTWSNISGATATTYTPISLTSSTYYRVAVTSGATAYTASVLVTILPPVSGGMVGNSQNINYNTVPAQLNLTGVSGGNGIYTYQWYYSIDGGTLWTVISGATAAIYGPGALTATTTYKVIVTSNGAQATSGYATVTVYPQLVTGTVSPSSQSINYNTVPTALSISGGSGGSGTNTYQWKSCATSNGTYTTINGATGSSYSPPAMTATVYYEVVTTSNGANVTSSPATVNVYPQLVAGVVNPASVTIGSGTSPGIMTCTPATGGGCGGNYTYQWYSSPDNATWTAISGAIALSYTPGNVSVTTYYMCKVNCGGQTANSGSGQVVIGTVPSSLNYIRTRMLSKPGVMDTVTADGLTSPVDVLQTTTYFDGLGRPIQAVEKQASPLQKDMVAMKVYDPLGREATRYLPFTSATGDGNYKPNANSEQSTFNSAQFPGEQYYYSKTVFEPSPLNRSQAVNPAGNSWVGSGRGIAWQYSVNTISDSVQNWTIASAPGSLPVDLGIYPVGALYKTQTVDEQGNQVISYYDLQERMILKKVQSSASPGPAHVGWLNTYYVFDTLANKRFIIQPRAVELINGSWIITQSIADELCFRYEYDYRSRLAIKKSPGSGETWMVYDGRDRLVMLQDSNLRSQGKWIVTEYDGLNRFDSSGLMTDNHSLPYWQNLAINSSYCPNISGFPYQLQKVSHYDNYSWVPGGISPTMTTTYTGSGSYFITTYNASPTYAVPITYFPITRGVQTGAAAYVIGSGQLLTSVNFYDDRGRLIQLEDVNISNGIDITTSQYDFSGKPIRLMLVHKKNGLPAAQTHIVLTKLAYDPSFRLKSVFKNIDGQPADQLIDSVQYSERGRMSTKFLGNNVDNMAFTYNVRGWLTGINPNYVNGSANNYFGMELGYDKTGSVAPGNTYKLPEYSGNIEGTVWKTAGSGINRKYDFTYDPANRLTGADFNQYNGSGFDKSGKVDFSVSNLTYDANSNILTMNQQGFLVGGSQPIDGLTYTYMNGGASNQLAGVTDANNNATTQLGDFHYNPATKGAADYAYDGDGNLRIDNNKGIDSISYNYLGQPQYVHLKGAGTITYTYDARGAKWRKIITDNVRNLSTTVTYIGGFEYQQVDNINNPGGGYDTIQFMLHEDGRARWSLHTYLNGTTGYGWDYDFFEKDHLGNTRVVLTQE